jgi:hypothetical protein
MQRVLAKSDCKYFHSIMKISANLLHEMLMAESNEGSKSEAGKNTAFRELNTSR